MSTEKVKIIASVVSNKLVDGKNKFFHKFVIFSPKEGDDLKELSELVFPPEKGYGERHIKHKNFNSVLFAKGYYISDNLYGLSLEGTTKEGILYHDCDIITANSLEEAEKAGLRICKIKFPETANFNGWTVCAEKIIPLLKQLDRE